jgi:hypothetical protein
MQPNWDRRTSGASETRQADAGDSADLRLSPRRTFDVPHVGRFVMPFRRHAGPADPPSALDVPHLALRGADGKMGDSGRVGGLSWRPSTCMTSSTSS